MALYYYQAFSKEGKKVTGYLDATTERNVREQLTKQALYPVKIELATPGVGQSWWSRLFSRKVSVKEKILFTKQLALLLKSGIPLLQALELLIDYFEGQFHTMLVAIKDDVKSGSSFAQSLGKYSKEFDVIYVQLVRAGEATGKLETVLDHLTNYLDRREQTKKKIRSAFRMPLIQLGVALVVVVILLYKVVPTMARTLKGDLPWYTRFLVSLSDFVVSYYILLIIVVLFIVVVFQYWRSTESGAEIIDRIKLRLPLISYFSRIGTVVQFSRTLGILLQAGVNLAEALDIVVKIIDNRVLAHALSDARDKIVKQGKITQYLKQTGIFPPIAIYLINTGEQSGSLDTMLLMVAENYDEELFEITENLTAKLGPLLLIVMALIVGFIVMAIAGPMAQMASLANLRR